MGIMESIGSMFGGGSSDRAAGMAAERGDGGFSYGPYGNLSQSEYRGQYGGRDGSQTQRMGGQGAGQGTAKAKPKTIDELMKEFDVTQYVPTAPATSYMPFYNAIPLGYANTMGPQSAPSQMDVGQMVQQSLLAAPQPSMPSGILGPSMQTQTPLTAPISYEDFLRYYRGGQ